MRYTFHFSYTPSFFSTLRHTCGYKRWSGCGLVAKENRDKARERNHDTTCVIENRNKTGKLSYHTIRDAVAIIPIARLSISHEKWKDQIDGTSSIILHSTPFNFCKFKQWNLFIYHSISFHSITYLQSK